MPTVEMTSRPFVPGTTGWTAADLEDPAVERLWFQGRYEIINGVLTSMPPAYFLGTRSLFKLVFALNAHVENRHIPGEFGGEVDIFIDDDRIVRADAVRLTAEDWERQRQAALKGGKVDPARTRILIPPNLVIESVSPGHERHDERTKRRWYAEFGVPNYWILDGFSRTLRCLVLDGADYRVDAEGRGDQQVRPSLFPELTINLASLWLEA
jgi:Uma2 family endonuclease